MSSLRERHAWTAAVADVHRKSALCRSSFESLFGAAEKQKTTRLGGFLFLVNLWGKREKTVDNCFCEVPEENKEYRTWL